MKKTCLLALAAGMACCSMALAKPPLEKARPGVEIEPVRIAKVKKVDGQIRLDGDWIPYTGGGIGTRNPQVNAPFYDSYGREPALAPTGSAGTNCVPSCDTAPDTGGRWYFGTAYHNPNTVEDMQDCQCPPNSAINEVNLGWMWAVAAPSPLVIIYFPLEEVMEFDGAICGDPATFSDTGGGGVALDYGPAVPPSSPFYYYSRPTGFGFLGVLSPGTDDNGDANGYADGSYQMIIADHISATAIVLAAGPTQPMLWGTADNGRAPAEYGPGHNNADSFDDDSPTDGILLDPAECYDYTFGVCPDPLGKDNVFCYLRCPADFNNDGFVDGIDSDQFNNCFEQAPGSLPQPAADLNGDCFVDGIDADMFANEFESAC